jgi:hypothetical protein
LSEIFFRCNEEVENKTKFPKSRHLWHRAISQLRMNTPPSEDIAAFGNLSPVVDVDVFADETVDLAPTTMPLPSQLANTEDGTIVPAAGSLGSPAAGSLGCPAAGSLHRPGSDSDRLTESQLRQILEYRNDRITDRISEAERQRLSDSSLRQEMERQADDSRPASYLERELTDDQLTSAT